MIIQSIFSRNGFTSAVREVANERHDLRLFTAEDVVDTLKSSGSS